MNIIIYKLIQYIEHSLIFIIITKKVVLKLKISMIKIIHIRKNIKILYKKYKIQKPIRKHIKKEPIGLYKDAFFRQNKQKSKQ